MRDSHPDLDEMISNYVTAAPLEIVANKANAIVVAYDSGIDEPEIVPVSRFLVQNPNIKTMLTYKVEVTKKDKEGNAIKKIDGNGDEVKDNNGNTVYEKIPMRMVDVLGKSKALKFMITNCVDYMTYFSQRHLMREHVKKDENLMELVKYLSKDDKEWTYQEDLSGIPGRHLVKALQEHDDNSREYLKFLARSWFGFAQIDPSRLMYETEDMIERELKKREIPLTRADYDLQGLFFSGEHGKWGFPALSSLRIALHDEKLREKYPNLEFPFRAKEVTEQGEIVAEEGMFFEYRKFSPQIIAENKTKKEGDKRHPLKESLPALVGSYVPRMFNAEGLWPIEELAPSMTKVIMAMAHMFVYPCKMPVQGIFGSLMHINDNEDPAVLTLPAEFEAYGHHKRKTLGARVNQRFAHPKDGRFNKEAKAESGVPVFDKIDTETFNNFLNSKILGTIAAAERSELEEPNLGLPYINPLDAIVAVHDSDRTGEILLTTFKGSRIPVGRISQLGSIEDICGNGKTLIALANSRSITRNKFFRFKFNFEKGFTLKGEYNVRPAGAHTIKEGIEIEPEGEHYSYRYTKVENTINCLGISGEHLYVLYDRHIEIRDLETLEVAKSKRFTKDVREPEYMVIDSRGYVFLQSADLDEIDKITVIDADLNVVGKIDHKKQILENNLKIQEFKKSHYLFYAIQNNTHVLCKDITEITNPAEIQSVDLEVKGNRGTAIFGTGIYRNPKTGTELLYIARVDNGRDDKKWLKVELYDKNKDGKLVKVGDKEMCPLTNPDEIGDIKSYGNYIIVGNRYYLLAKHMHRTDWSRDIEKKGLDMIMNFQILNEGA